MVITLLTLYQYSITLLITIITVQYSIITLLFQYYYSINNYKLILKSKLLFLYYYWKEIEMNIEDCSADIVILKNDFYRISLRAPSLTSLDEVHPSHREGVSLLQGFEGKGKYQLTKFHYHPSTQTFVTEIHKKKLKDKKNIVDFTQFLFKYWRYHMLQVKALLSKPFNYSGFKLESVDAIGYEFSKVFHEYNNKVIYFKFSELEFNNNIVQIDLTRNLFPSYAYSFNKGDYYKNPRLPFLEECSFHIKLQDLLFTVDKSFTIGFTLYSLHNFPKLLEDETNREKFQKIKNNCYVPDPLLEEVELKRKQFGKRVFTTTILTTSGKGMNTWTIQLELEPKCVLSIYHPYQRKPPGPGHQEVPNTYTPTRVIFKCLCFEQLAFRRLFQKLEPACGQIGFKFDQTSKEITVSYQYKNRLCFEYLLLSFEILWFKIADRRSCEKRIENTKLLLVIDQVAANIVEVTYGNFYMRFIIKENDEYEIQNIRTDYTKDRVEAIRAEARYQSFVPSSANQPGFRTESERTEDLREVRKPLYDEYPGLRTYLNFQLNNWTSKQYTQIAKLCDTCSRTDINQPFKGLLNKVIDGVNLENTKPNQIVKISTEREEKDKKEFGMNVMIKKYEVSIQMQANKVSKLTVNYQNDDVTKYESQNTKPQFFKTAEAYKPDLLF